MIALRNILLPIDFSDASWAATEYALRLAGEFGSTLHLLHVIEDAALYVPMFESYAVPSREQFETYAEDRLENWLRPEDRERCKSPVYWVHGRPAAEIVRFAQDRRMDLIVLGTHGRGAAAHLLLGSVAERVVNKALCPVLTVNRDAAKSA